MLYPLTFTPIFKERLWGRRSLESLYHKQLPANLPIGESWEISDRPGDVSVIDSGPLAGKDLHWLIEHARDELLGKVRLLDGRFPLLLKILDAQEKLSLQVHPPASIAPELKGDPKTEMWYLTHAEPGAELFAGLRRGVTRREFEDKLKEGTVAECFHRIPVRAGDAMFVPSGRVHAIGAGCVIFEIQQNSDTTYRVFDWNRRGAGGKARDLHVPESLRSIDFDDFEPALIATQFHGSPERQVRSLASCPWFEVEAIRTAGQARIELGGELLILAVVRGELVAESAGGVLRLGPGRFCLLPANLSRTVFEAGEPAEFLVIRPK